MTGASKLNPCAKLPTLLLIVTATEESELLESGEWQRNVDIDVHDTVGQSPEGSRTLGVNPVVVKYHVYV
jgi:hypothetical protein